jgi:hypothetical protein
MGFWSSLDLFGKKRRQLEADAERIRKEGEAEVARVKEEGRKSVAAAQERARKAEQHAQEMRDQAERVSQIAANERQQRLMKDARDATASRTLQHENVVTAARQHRIDKERQETARQEHAEARIRRDSGTVSSTKRGSSGSASNRSDDLLNPLNISSPLSPLNPIHQSNYEAPARTSYNPPPCEPTPSRYESPAPCRSSGYDNSSPPSYDPPSSPPSSFE